MAWDEFSNLVADALDLELDRRTNNMGSDSVEPDLPFLKLDARIAVRAYLRNSKSNPDTAADIFFRSISRFSDPDTKDRKVWGNGLCKGSNQHDDGQHVARPEMETRSSIGTEGHKGAPIGSDRSPKVTVTLPMTDHTADVHKPSPGPPSVREQQTAGHPPMVPEIRISSLRREAWLRSGHTLDKPLVFLHHCLAEEDHIKEQTLSEINGRERVDHLYEGLTTWRQFSQLLAGSLDLQDGRRDDGFTEEEQFRMRWDIHPNVPSDQISQFTATPEEDGAETASEDDFISESLFSLADVQRAIRSYSHNGISFNELRNILLTEHPSYSYKKILNSLFKKLEEEDSLATRVVG
ncbi:hypothetical protein DFJ58DRAFT_842338 [Suillus subalutaceus]|uniref:uncharacterized protein n=1 Tax=Suillus subalutaceus TaxID=48586 RepID=UPI001B88602E|nr:uncharacterized protein DFJ58DRAFT_842338 [Suillus subalutaceus]KAG1850840.1 hypothetical protein DFJ58DRAFT_842338 [Suillus subalutaceus]